MPLLLVLLGEFTYDNPEKVRCERTIEILNEHHVRYESIIGTNHEEKAARKLLFQLAGIGNEHYPQFFYEDYDDDVIYLGDIYFLEAMALCNSIPGAGEAHIVDDDDDEDALYDEEVIDEELIDEDGIDDTIHTYISSESNNDHNLQKEKSVVVVPKKLIRNWMDRMNDKQKMKDNDQNDKTAVVSKDNIKQLSSTIQTKLTTSTSTKSSSSSLLQQQNPEQQASLPLSPERTKKWNPTNNVSPYKKTPIQVSSSVSDKINNIVKEKQEQIEKQKEQQNQQSLVSPPVQTIKKWIPTNNNISSSSYLSPHKKEQQEQKEHQQLSSPVRAKWNTQSKTISSSYISPNKTPKVSTKFMDMNTNPNKDDDDDDDDDNKNQKIIIKDDDTTIPLLLPIIAPPVTNNDDNTNNSIQLSVAEINPIETPLTRDNDDDDDDDDNNNSIQVSAVESNTIVPPLTHDNDDDNNKTTIQVSAAETNPIAPLTHNDDNDNNNYTMIQVFHNDDDDISKNNRIEVSVVDRNLIASPLTDNINDDDDDDKNNSVQVVETINQSKQDDNEIMESSLPQTTTRKLKKKSYNDDDNNIKVQKKIPSKSVEATYNDDDDDDNNNKNNSIQVSVVEIVNQSDKQDDNNALIQSSSQTLTKKLKKKIYNDDDNDMKVQKKISSKLISTTTSLSASSYTSVDPDITEKVVVTSPSSAPPFNASATATPVVEAEAPLPSTKRITSRSPLRPSLIRGNSGEYNDQGKNINENHQQPGETNSTSSSIAATTVVEEDITMRINDTSTVVDEKYEAGECSSSSNERINNNNNMSKVHEQVKQSPHSLRPGLISDNSIEQIDHKNNNVHHQNRPRRSIWKQKQPQQQEQQQPKQIDDETHRNQLKKPPSVTQKSTRSLRPGVIRGNSMDRIDNNDDNTKQKDVNKEDEENRPATKANLSFMRPGMIRGNSIDHMEKNDDDDNNENHHRHLDTTKNNVENEEEEHQNQQRSRQEEQVQPNDISKTSPRSNNNRSLRPGMMRGNSIEHIIDNDNIVNHTLREEQTNPRQINQEQVQDQVQLQPDISKIARSNRSLRPGMMRGNSVKSIVDEDNDNDIDSPNTLKEEEKHPQQTDQEQIVHDQLQLQPNISKIARSNRSLRPGMMRGNSMERIDNNNNDSNTHHDALKEEKKHPQQSDQDDQVQEQSVSNKNENIVSKKFVKQRSLRPGLLRGNSFDTDNDTSIIDAIQASQTTQECRDMEEEKERKQNDQASVLAGTIRNRDVPKDNLFHREKSLRPLILRGNSFDSDDNIEEFKNHGEHPSPSLAISSTRGGGGDINNQRNDAAIVSGHPSDHINDDQSDDDDDDDDDTSMTHNNVLTVKYTATTIISKSVKRSLRPGMVRGNSFEELLSQTLQSERTSLHIHSNHICRHHNYADDDNDNGDDFADDESSTDSGNDNVVFEKRTSIVLEQYSGTHTSSSIPFIKPYAIKGSTLRNASYSLSHSQHGSTHGTSRHG